MDIKYSYDYIQIGLLLRRLRNVNEMFEVKDMLDSLNTVEKCLGNVGFKVTPVLFLSTSFLDFKKGLEQLKEGSLIGKENAASLVDFCEGLETTLFAESGTKMVYSVPERRYNHEFLSETPEKLLNEGVFGKLSDIAKYDFTSACRCILYGEATAAAFHTLRATEDTLKQYYFHHKRTKRLAKPMWGPMTQQLRDKKRSSPPETVLNSLDLVRISYRNPTQHPEVIYDINSAQDLFGVCIDLLNKMVSELP